MISEPMENGWMTVTPYRDARTGAPMDAKPSAAAFDHVFDGLSEAVSTLEQMDAPMVAPTATGLGSIPMPMTTDDSQALDPALLRSLADQLEHQRQRLTKLLRDINSAGNPL